PWNPVATHSLRSGCGPGGRLATSAPLGDILSTLNRAEFGLLSSRWGTARKQATTVSVQESRYIPHTVPTCHKCLTPMVLWVRREVPLTNLGEETYRCQTCNTERKRMVKDR